MFKVYSDKQDKYGPCFMGFMIYWVKSCSAVWGVQYQEITRVGAETRNLDQEDQESFLRKSEGQVEI